MIGSTEQISDALEALRRQDFDEWVQEIEYDHEREEDILEPERPWLYEKEPLSPLLEAMVKDVWMRINQSLIRRQYQHSREWL